MPRPLLGLLVTPCILVQSTHHSYHDGFVGQIASEIFRHVPRGGESTQKTDELAMAKGRDQPWYPFSPISAFRVLHKKSMLVKESEEEEKLEFVLGEEEEKGGPNNAAVEVSSSFTANFIDDDANRSSSAHTAYLADDGRTVEIQDSQMGDIKGKISALHSQDCDSPSKSRRTRRNVAGKKTPRRRQSRSHRDGSSNIDSSIGLDDGNIWEEGCLERNMDDLLRTGLDGKVLYVLEETNEQSIGKNDFAMPLYNHSAECRESLYISSGYWATIDALCSFGKSATYPGLRLSRYLRPLRKIAAKTTGLHGIVSQKNCTGATHPLLRRNKPSVQDNNEHVFRSKTDTPSMVAIENRTTSDANVSCSRQIRRGNRMRRFSRLLSFGRQNRNTLSHNSTDSVGLSARQTGSMLNHSALHGNLSFGSSIKDITVIKEMRKRAERVKEIDRMICRIQKDVVELQCEKDDLQRRPNPLYNYTSVYPSEDRPGGGRSSTETCLANRTVREFNFPPPQFADAYIEDLVDSGRLIMLNHTHLWQRQKDDFDGAKDDMDEDELAGGLPSGLSSSSNARISDGVTVEKKYKNSRGSSGSWFLRQSLGRGLSLGEKIGETVELAAYRAVCTSVMSILARGVSALHGVNVMTHSDIRIFVETAPDLPPVAKGALPDGEKYAEEAIRKAIRRSAKKRKKKSRNYQGRSSGPTAEGDEVFLQRDAVIETLISHCQISAPLLKLFPLSWQRALLGNIITLVGAVVSDFVDGIQIQILGHQLSLSFKPITEKDVMNSIVGFGGARHRASVEEFEAAVEATARDVSKSLEFLDRWHERALGGSVLRAQIGNLVARVVLTLTDEVLGGAKFDLWSAQIGGPRIVAGLEHRIEDTQQT